MALLKSDQIKSQKDPFSGYYEVFLTLLIAEIAKVQLPSIAMLLMVEHSMNQLDAAYLRLIYPFSLYPFLYPMSHYKLSQAFLSWERGEGLGMRLLISTLVLKFCP